MRLGASPGSRGPWRASAVTQGSSGPSAWLRRGAMGGTTRASAWWAPNAPDLEAGMRQEAASRDALSSSGRLGRSGAPRPLGAPLCGPSTTRQPLPVLRRGAMGGTTRASAWWAPNAPDLHASTSGRSGAPRPLGAPLCGPSERPGGRSARPSRDPAARPKGRMRRAPLNWAGWRPSRFAGPFHSAPPRWFQCLSEGPNRGGPAAGWWDPIRPERLQRSSDVRPSRMAYLMRSARLSQPSFS